MTLDQNCNNDLPRFTCTLGNIASIISTVLWFLVLLPQIFRNQSRKSVKGLNVLWAIANFLASLCNVIFMFRITVPIQTRVQAIYMPCLEFVILLQFYAWWEESHEKEEERARENSNNTKQSSGKKFIAGIILLIVVAVILLTQVFEYDSSSYFAWAAIVLWSVETFPQLYTNLANPLQAVAGQSVISILITILGKTADSVSAYSLVMPEQTRILAYFSGTSAWLNAFMVLVIYITRSQKRNESDEESEERTIHISSSSPAENILQYQSRDHDEADDEIQSKRENHVANITTSSSTSISDRIEQSIRSALISHRGLRVALGVLLICLIVGVIVACFFLIEPTWVVFLMIASSCMVMISFFFVLKFCAV